MAVDSLRGQLSSFEIEEVLGLDDPDKKIDGSGSFGTVCEVTVNGVPRIAKQLHRSFMSPDIDPDEKKGLYERFYKECLLLSGLDNPNIVRFIGVHFGSDQMEFDMSLIMEKLHSDLEKYLNENPNVSIHQKLSVLLDVSTGLLYLHSQDPPIIHRDLKTENILLTTDLKAKIADFGVSRALNISPNRLASLTKCPGSLAYMPPEALQEHPAYGKTLDVFSFGEVCLCTIHQTFAEVFNVTNHPDMPAACQRGEVEILKRKKWIDTMPSDHVCLRDIVRFCLKDKSAKRPTTPQLREMMEEVCLKKHKEFPYTLEGFGYHFVDGRLRNIETGEGFVFEVKKGDRTYNKTHYDALVEVITQEVYKLLQTSVGLKRVNIPNGATKPCSFFFMSEDALTADKLMVLIHGSGSVRAGQWSRRLIIHDSLESGTQLPYIERARKKGYGVIVTNTNENAGLVEGVSKQHKDSGTPEEHASYVWKNCVMKAKAKHIDIMAHSYGGVVTVSLMNQFFTDFKQRVKKIAFTNSTHTYDLATVGPPKWHWLAENAINWMSSVKPLDTELDPGHDGVRRLSAGTLKHIETSYKSVESVFRFLTGDHV